MARAPLLLGELILRAPLIPQCSDLPVPRDTITSRPPRSALALSAPLRLAINWDVNVLLTWWDEVLIFNAAPTPCWLTVP